MHPAVTAFLTCNEPECANHRHVCRGCGQLDKTKCTEHIDKELYMEEGPFYVHKHRPGGYGDCRTFLCTLCYMRQRTSCDSRCKSGFAKSTQCYKCNGWEQETMCNPCQAEFNRINHCSHCDKVNGKVWACACGKRGCNSCVQMITSNISPITLFGAGLSYGRYGNYCDECIRYVSFCDECMRHTSERAIQDIARRGIVQRDAIYAELQRTRKKMKKK